VQQPLTSKGAEGQRDWVYRFTSWILPNVMESMPRALLRSATCSKVPPANRKLVQDCSPPVSGQAMHVRSTTERRIAVNDFPVEWPGLGTPPTVAPLIPGKSIPVAAGPVRDIVRE
jgi:hypothetical protein